MQEPSRTVWDVHAGEALKLSLGGEAVLVEPVHKSGRLVRLVVQASRDISVTKEVETRSKHGTLSPA